MVVHSARMRSVVRWNNVDFVPGLQRDRRRGLGGRKDLILRFLDKGRELVCTVCETGAGESGEYDELFVYQ
jgi:hypothetical protein